MKERPIIFTGDMVRAILAGRKTQTRRVVKPQPACMSGGNWYPSDVPGDRRNRTGKHYASEEHMRRGLPIDFSSCGQPGDRLWVREAWAKIYVQDGCIKADEWDNPPADGCPGCAGCRIEYKADTDAKYPGGWDDDMGGDPECPKWKSPYHMFRWMSRITLEITGVRVERLQDISVSDCQAEGIGYRQIVRGGNTAFPQDYQRAFADLWDSLNAKRHFPWAANPWVWVIEFRRIS